MHEALALAEHAVGVSDPNPRVGCVIVRGDEILGRGHTQHAGGAHAEVMALADAATRGADVRGATVHVTLEPCSHHGRTPPCADALAAAGVGRVVIALRDPNPLVSGAGATRLAAAGIAVDWCDAAAAPSRELNIGFISRMERGRPWLRMKVALSLDGRSALADGTSQWITGPAARADGHSWRKRAGAVVTGVGTVREDDPRLDVRLVETAHQPLRVIVDSRLETPAGARILQPPGQVLVYAALDDRARRGVLEARGVAVALAPSPSGKVDLAAMLGDLGRREINELHVEAGEKLNASLLAAGLVDELLVYVAPKLLGGGRGLAAIAPLARLDDAPGFAFVDVERVGDDLRLRLRPRQRSACRTLGH
ncbi:MAG: bifunctional diaminohydroxyphosphoribosylaminopyrimidine deaminase/5-amino-6-(5-phosphoribosylamino)uracil reductase RibD [Rhizobacter sp.]|nr:bifunctional diaminohydroxyphosphoribosylaminopyrimidine deaminase/5-amino-6-(5-phosphoribosylamino)uracil reductase RibD [Rhizobacter sp.]